MNVSNQWDTFNRQRVVVVIGVIGVGGVVVVVVIVVIVIVIGGVVGGDSIIEILRCVHIRLYTFQLLHDRLRHILVRHMSHWNTVFIR